MKYLIFYNNNSFYTKWYDYENNYMDDMIVFDLSKHLYTTDGINWKEIEEDHL